MRVDVGSSGDGEELTATYGGLRDGLSLTVRWRAGADDEGVVGSIEVENASGSILEDIEFPFLILSADPGNAPEKTRLFMPGGDGYVAGREGQQYWMPLLGRSVGRCSLASTSIHGSSKAKSSSGMPSCLR